MTAQVRCPCCGGEMVEEARKAKSVTLRCTVCRVSDVRLLPHEEMV